MTGVPVRQGNLDRGMQEEGTLLWQPSEIPVARCIRHSGPTAHTPEFHSNHEVNN